MAFNCITSWLDDHVDEMIDLQRELTSIPALNPETGGDGEWEKASFIEDWLHQHGLDNIQHYDTPDNRLEEGARPNFVIRIPGRSTRPRTWVMTHMDVVPPGEKMEDGTYKGWNSNPFEVNRDGDYLYGRGVEDNQQSMVANLFAARALAECDVTPPRPVGILLVSAEETGSEYGLKRLLDDHDELFSEEDIILVPDGGNDSGTMIEVAEKSLLWLTFTITGEQTHGSTPQLGCNAFRAGIRLAANLDETLSDRFDAEDELYHPATSTFEPTRHERNVPNVNTIPGTETFSFDCRVLPRYELDEVLDCIREEMQRVDGNMGTTTELTVENRLSAAPPTSPDAPVVDMLKQSVETVYDVEAEPMGIGGNTVASHFREKGYPAVVWSRILATAHQANECCRIPNMLGDSKVFANMYLQEIPEDSNS